MITLYVLKLISVEKAKKSLGLNSEKSILLPQ